MLAPAGEKWGSLHFDPRPPHALYSLGKHLSRSEDRGSSWQVLTDVPAASYEFELAPHPGHARYLLGESGLLYKFVE
ncbi:MAG TPA: hypothetical protein VJV79_08625 [Polyangiaceae bacterium]|nr:hypothetical protein [Polyangiaceae bacterium]